MNNKFISKKKIKKADKLKTFHSQTNKNKQQENSTKLQF